MSESVSRRRDILLTSLIDLLLQILFLFLLVLLVYARPEDRQTLRDAKELTQTTGVSMFEIKERWSRLVDPEQLEKETKDLVKNSADYERLKKLEKEYLTLSNEHKKRGDLLAQRERELERRRQALGFRPCWTSVSGQPEFLMRVAIGDDNVLVTPAWPRHRDQDVEKISVPKDALNSRISVQRFQVDFRSVLEASQRANCRHYAIIEIVGESAERTTRNRSIVENYFYVILRKAP